MRTGCLCALLVCLAAAEAVVGQSGQAGEVIAAVRQALGGEAALTAVRRVRARGRASRNVGPLRVASEIEWLVDLPDRFLRIDRLGIGGSSSEVAVGFNGRALVQRVAGPGGVRVDPSASLPPELRATTGEAAVTGAREDLARLLLGFLGASPILPAEFTFVGVAEAPDGRADVLDVRGAAGFEARLFLDVNTRLPLMVTWMGPDLPGIMRAVAGPPAAAPPDGTRDEIRAAGERLVEHRLYFLEYRQVERRLRWPFRIRRSVAGETVEEIAFERFVLNPEFDARTFEAR